MEYQINGRKFNIFPQNLQKIGSGKEGISYNVNGKVLKLYHLIPKKKFLNYEECRYLTALSTRRVLLPRQVVLSKNNNIRGYVAAPYIEKKEKIYDIMGSKFIEEYKAIKNELEYLGENYVMAGDFTLENFICSDKFYLVDPGSYLINFDMMEEDSDRNKKYLANLNVHEFNQFMYKAIIFRYLEKYLNDPALYNMIVLSVYNSYLKSEYPDMMEYIMGYIKEDAPLKEGIKQLFLAHKK